jgi:hypothetical protein
LLTSVMTKAEGRSTNTSSLYKTHNEIG